MSSAMDAQNYAGKIWDIADEVRDAILPKDYNKVVLPFTLLRRLECVLEPTRDLVIKAYNEHVDEWGADNDNYCQFSGKAFYNRSSYRLNDLSKKSTLKNINSYVESFSPNVRAIFKCFEFESICTKLQNSDPPLLYSVCRKFGSKEVDLSPEVVDDRTMSNIYEHLIQRFGESIAEGAEDFMTPKDVVRLAVAMVMATGEEELLSSDDGVVRTIYDPTAGTCGFISDAMDYIAEVQSRKSLKVPAKIVPYGQEVEPESWAMGKTNLLIRNVANNELDEHDQKIDMSAHLYFGNTLLKDMAEDTSFDLIFANPPFGKKWSKEQSHVLEEAKTPNSRFYPGIPSINDGAMLFLEHVAYKLKKAEEGGGKAAIVLSASPLFNGDAGSGPSNIRRWLLEKDYVDCIVKLPESIFFRTNITTYLWILSTRKEESRKGYVQLIDASEYATLLKKNLGKKRFEVSDEDIQKIVQMYVDGKNTDKTVVVPWQDFCYRQVTVQRPLRRVIRITDDNLALLKKSSSFMKLDDNIRNMIIGSMTTMIGSDNPYEWALSFSKECKKKYGFTKPTPSAIEKDIVSYCSVYDADASVVCDKYGNPFSDPDLKDTENIPFNMSFESYMAKEVLPFAPNAWIDNTVTDEKGPLADHEVGAVGTEISFNKYFYKYIEPRLSNDIAKEISEEQKGLDVMLQRIFK